MVRPTQLNAFSAQRVKASSHHKDTLNRLMVKKVMVRVLMRKPKQKKRVREFGLMLESIKPLPM